jgi:hypothetical protein
MSTINPDDVKKYIDGLYEDGATSNERLQELIWRLKMLSELPNEELGIAADGDFRYFFIKYLTELANRHHPTNSSDLPKKLLEIHCANLQLVELLVKVIENYENSLSKDVIDASKTKSDLANDFTLVIRHLMADIKDQYFSSQNKINDWLKEIKY